MNIIYLVKKKLKKKYYCKDLVIFLYDKLIYRRYIRKLLLYNVGLYYTSVNEGTSPLFFINVYRKYFFNLYISICAKERREPYHDHCFDSLQEQGTTGRVQHQLVLLLEVANRGKA